MEDDMNFKNPIQVIYPPNNNVLFEQWFDENYKGCNTDRELLPVYFNGFYVNNNYGNDLKAREELQQFLYSLDRNKKWFSIIQYDDSILDDVSHLDLFRFEMSKNIGCPIPLLCQPHPYFYPLEKKYIASFVGSRTHPLRDRLEQFKGREGWYISFEPHSIDDYCRILAQSKYSLCPRGYGLNSFRTAESLQYDCVPVYISDEFILPFNESAHMILCTPSQIDELPEFLESITEHEYTMRRQAAEWAYKKYYTYEGCLKEIINVLNAEYNKRQI